MKPTVVFEDFDPPGTIATFVNEAIGEILQVSPYDSHFEATIKKEETGYVMAISINYAEGQFTVTAQDPDLKCVVTQGTAQIFSQVRNWWKSRFDGDRTEETDWASNLARDSENPLDFVQKSNITLDVERSLRVLVVDDDIESIAPLELCLERLGCTVFFVNNGFEAIHEIVSSDRTYDAIILDWTMPEMTGGQTLYNAQKIIYHSPATKKHWQGEQIPVITFSGKTYEEIDLPECKNFLHLDHWEKPVSYLNLFNKVSETLSKLALNKY